MDGQRRFTQSLKRFGRRLVRSNMLRSADTRLARGLVRSGAVLFLFAAIASGLAKGGQLQSVDANGLTLGDHIAAAIGLSAKDIEIAGLANHEPAQLLKVLGIRPGGSLIGFDAGQAKRLLEGVDWIEQANIQRKYPNRLDIDVVERKAFAIWQRGQARYLIDRHGIAMSEDYSSNSIPLLLVSGEGANVGVEELINELEATPDLLVRVSAAARVGKRRWNLYLDNGVKILLPEQNVSAALKSVHDFDGKTHVLERGITELDLRIASQIRVSVIDPDQVAMSNSSETVSRTVNQ